MTRTVTATINGSGFTASVEERTCLGDFLRDCSGLTGTHLGCEHGVCGACTVMLDDKPVRSCLVYAVQVNEKKIETVEGFQDDPVMERLRQAFSENHALQCGFCTPGMLITARDIVTRLGNIDEKRIREELAGNLCRCTGYVGIVRAIKQVAAENIAVPEHAAVSTQPAAGTVVHNAAPAVTPQPSLVPPKSKATPAAVLSPKAPAAARGDATVVTQTFKTNFPIGDVWHFFADPLAVAACLPGAEVDSVSGEVIAGKVRIKMGPIKAHFAGDATYKRDDAKKAGSVEGSGIDSLSNSRANGSLEFALSPESEKMTSVDLVLSFTLQGMLAQFSRPALVRDFVGFMVGQFAQNLSRALEAQGAGTTFAKAESLTFWQLAHWWVKRLFKK